LKNKVHKRFPPVTIVIETRVKGEKMETGSWKIDVNTSGMPQKVASAMAALET